MSNTMYLVCTHHPDQVHSCRIAVRGATVGYASLRRVDQLMEKFFKEHEHCGGGFDHFTIAFDLAKDHDLPKIEPVADNVVSILKKARMDS